MKKQMMPDTGNGIEVREGKEIMDTLINNTLDYNQEEQLQYAFNIGSTRARDAIQDQLSTLVIIDKYFKVLASQTNEEEISAGLLSEISELSNAVSASLRNLRRVMRNENASFGSENKRPRSAISAATAAAQGIEEDES